MFTTTPPVPDHYEPLLLKTVLKELDAGKEPAERGPDEFPIFASDPLAAAHRVVTRFMVAANGKYRFRMTPDFKVREQDGASEMLDADADGKFTYLLAAVSRELWYWKHKCKKQALDGTKLKGWRIESDQSLYALKPLAQALLRSFKGPVSHNSVVQILDAVAIEQVGKSVREYAPVPKLLPIVADSVQRNGVDDAIRECLLELKKRFEINKYDQGSYLREKTEINQQIDAILNPAAPVPKVTIVESGEPWANTVLDEVGSDSKWIALLEHAADSEASQPSQKWQKQAKTLVDAIGMDKFEKSLVSWFDLMLKPREVPLTREQLREITNAFHHEVSDVYSHKNEIVMKGLTWIAGVLDRPAVARGLSALAERCYKKIPQIGPRAPKVANACLVALAMMNGREAAGELSRLKAIVKQPTGRKMIDKALARMAGNQNVSVEDLEEQNVPTYGLVDGVTERKFGSTTLRITITPLAEVEQTWLADGKPRKSPPSDLKTKHADALKALKRELADLDKTLTAQRLRIERLFLRRTPWPMKAWLGSYHDHALIRFFSRRLIWRFSPSEDASPITAAWDGKKFVDAADKAVKLDPAKTFVRLWHPSISKPADVQAWRRWLEKHEITQPFKQAHREVYLLTDAERRTDTYSNRFAGHILRQHQFQALCQQRGWKYQLMGGFDFHNTPMIDIPTWNARVEFWVEISEEGELAASGIATHVATDQVRFCTPAGEPQHLADVPALLLSELFRDVDLFVGVASVGNDPTWYDRVQENRHHTYWRQYATADLTETGKTRRDALETLLPRLTKLRDKWTLQENFLVIRGSLRTYKIHLGSGNILMEPNDQYLCIVPDRSKKSENVFLPFEGDNTLAVILSKAFLLADDTKIADPSIIRQIKPD